MSEEALTDDLSMDGVTEEVTEVMTEPDSDGVVDVFGERIVADADGAVLEDDVYAYEISPDPTDEPDTTS